MHAFRFVAAAVDRDAAAAVRSAAPPSRRVHSAAARALIAVIFCLHYNTSDSNQTKIVFFIISLYKKPRVMQIFF